MTAPFQPASIALIPAFAFSLVQNQGRTLAKGFRRCVFDHMDAVPIKRQPCILNHR